MTTKDGGPAFPVTTYAIKDGRIEHQATGFGMSLRDYFAAAALQGLISGMKNNDPVFMRQLSNGVQIDRSWVADTAYQYADAMLAERDKPRMLHD